MVYPAEARYAPPTPRPMTDAEEIAQMKRESAKARREAQQAAVAQAKADTAKTRADADAAVGRYNGKVRQHQRDWLRHNGYKYHTQEALQAAWEAAWKVDGKQAEDELAPYITAYDQAVQKELRTAAGQSPEALASKLTEIRDLDTSGSDSDALLDKIATIDAGLIGQETPELRAAAQNFQLASVAWDAAQANPSAVGFENTKAAYESAKTE